MKRIRTFVAGISLAFLLGCASTQTDSAQVISTLAIYNATFYILENNPELRPQFEAALAELDAAATGGISAEGLLAILKRIPSEGDAEKLKPAITSAQILIQSYIGIPETPETSEKLKKWAAVVASGIRLGLQDSN